MCFLCYISLPYVKIIEVSFNLNGSGGCDSWGESSGPSFPSAGVVEVGVVGMRGQLLLLFPILLYWYQYFPHCPWLPPSFQDPFSFKYAFIITFFYPYFLLFFWCGQWRTPFFWGGLMISWWWLGSYQWCSIDFYVVNAFLMIIRKIEWNCKMEFM